MKEWECFDADTGKDSAREIRESFIPAFSGYTATLSPRLGRARPLAERSVGTPDAGATSMALIIATVGKVLSGNQSQREFSRASVNG